MLLPPESSRGCFLATRQLVLISRRDAFLGGVRMGGEGLLEQQEVGVLRWVERRGDVGRHVKLYLLAVG
jgi:hypothetical protein